MSFAPSTLACGLLLASSTLLAVCVQNGIGFCHSVPWDKNFYSMNSLDHRPGEYRIVPNVADELAVSTRKHVFHMVGSPIDAVIDRPAGTWPITRNIRAEPVARPTR